MADTLQHYLRAFRIRELQYVLKQFGLPHSGGRKADLLQRIQTYLECVVAVAPSPTLPEYHCSSSLPVVFAAKPLSRSLSLRLQTPRPATGRTPMYVRLRARHDGPSRQHALREPWGEVTPKHQGRISVSLRRAGTRSAAATGAAMRRSGPSRTPSRTWRTPRGSTPT